MRPSLFAIMLIATFSAAASLHAEFPKQNKVKSSDAPSNKKDAVHLVSPFRCRNEANLHVFSLSPITSQYRFSKISGEGNYRLTVDPQGNVTEIKIFEEDGGHRKLVPDVDILKSTHSLAR